MTQKPTKLTQIIQADFHVKQPMKLNKFKGRRSKAASVLASKKAWATRKRLKASREASALAEKGERAA
jgi:hypothetical protein